MGKEEEERREHGTTKSGHRYVVNDDGLKIRDCLKNHRLKDDDETFDEYKARQRMIKNYVKVKEQGEVIWPSKNLDDAKRGYPSKNTLGTFNKEKVQQIMEEEGLESINEQDQEQQQEQDKNQDNYEG